MGEAGFVRFPGILDPRAQEFRPTNPYIHNDLTLLQPQIYYPYPCPPYPSTERQLMPFCEGSVEYYPQFAAAPAAYVRPAVADPPLPPPLPPPSMTPSRTLLLSSVPTHVSESVVRRELEVFGDVRAVQMERVRSGIVTVHFYDLRHAQAAMVAIQEQHMQQQCRLRNHFDALLTHHNSLFEPKLFVPPLPPPACGLIAGRAVWAQFMIPVTVGLPDGHNQGTLVIFNLESEVSTNILQEIFDAFGAIKELRETPLKRHQKFVEFYDIRDAAKALSNMNGKEINGKQVIIEFSRPGGHNKRFSKPSHNTTNKFNFPTNYSTRTSRCLPPPPPSPPPRKTTGCSPPYVSRIYDSQAQFCNKKSSFSKGNPNRTGGNRRAITNSGAVVASMGSLCLNGGNGIESAIEEECSDRPQKRNSKKNSTCNTITKQAKVSNRAWKGTRQSKVFDPRFLIDEDTIMESNRRDSRTTVMIKNIPNKYSQKLLLNMLDNHCIHCNEQIADGGDDQPLSSYDFVYLPIDFINKCNVGYGFVNMTSPEATWRLYKAFHFQNWEVFNSRKICEVTYARLQGVEALKEHFKNSKFPCETEEYLPVFFSPPRDGRRLTEPTTIVGRAISSPPPPAVSSKNGDNADKKNGGDLVEEVEESRHIIINVDCNDDDDDDDGDVSGGRSSSFSPTGGGSDDDDVNEGGENE